MQTQNPEMVRELRDSLKAQGFEAMPLNVAGTLQPVIEVNPRLLRRCSIVKTNTLSNGTSATIYTTPTDADFFLVGGFVSYTKDATSTSTNSNLRVTIDGATADVLIISGLTLTAEGKAASISFPVPIKVDRGTNILLLNSTAVANIRSHGGITGYLVPDHT